MSVSTMGLATFTQINVKRQFTFPYQPALRVLQIQDASTETGEPDIMWESIWDLYFLV